MKKNKYQCVIIGSFRKHYSEMINVIKLFAENDIEVLSPRISNILNPDEEFVIFDYDPEGASIREIEDLVLKKMHKSNFVYIVNPGGYIGLSASFEIGYCHGNSLRVYAMERSSELCCEYVDGVLNPKEMIKKIKEDK
jgi:hypothetical protein